MTADLGWDAMAWQEERVYRSEGAGGYRVRPLKMLMRKSSADGPVAIHRSVPRPGFERNEGQREVNERTRMDLE
jgi:hypothetical protein